MIYILLIIFQFKHFLADYPLQSPYMLGKFKRQGWIAPLTAHCTVHACFTLIIASVALQTHVAPPLLAAFDFTIHFTMDRIKASPAMLGRYKALSATEFVNAPTAVALHNNKLFWWSLGFDQMVHHLTDLAVVYLMVR